MYMRVYRQIAGCPRYGPDAALTDLAVRKLLVRPSLQCAIANSRLALLSSLLRLGNPSTSAMLSVRNAVGAVMPWVRLVLADLHALFSFHGDKLKFLGTPSLEANLPTWYRFILAAPDEWKVFVEDFCLFEMELDLALQSKAPTRGEASGTANGACSYACDVCSKVFASSRALSAHMRGAHRQRSNLRVFVDGSGTCPICRTQFASRIQALAHVSERRKRAKTPTVSCRDRLEAGAIPPLNPEVVLRLDAADKAARGIARKESGKSRPVVLVRATRSRIRSVPDAPSSTLLQS